MSNNINLTAGMRSNLSSLQNLNKALQTTQSRLSTGKKVNSALDNPATFYQASALNQRVSALDRLLDAMGQNMMSLQVANTGIEAGLKTLEQMKQTAQQAASLELLPETRPVETNTAATEAGMTIALRSAPVAAATEVEETTPTTQMVFEVGAAHDGKGNTQTWIEKFGENATVASYCNQFYAPGTSKNDENFGQGQWYLPAVGELIDAFGEVQPFYYRWDDGIGQHVQVSEEEYNNHGYIMETHNSNTGEMTRTVITKEEYQALLKDHIPSPLGEGDLRWEDGNIQVWVGSDYYREYQFSNLDDFGAITSSLQEIYNIDGGDIDNELQWPIFTSSDCGETGVWAVRPKDYDGSMGTVMDYNENFNGSAACTAYVLPFALLENKFADNEAKPEVGNIMYADLSYSSGQEYQQNHTDGKTAVGIVTWVSDDGASARIMGLHSLYVSDGCDEWGNTYYIFDPEQPYDICPSSITFYYGYGDNVWRTDITGIADINNMRDPCFYYQAGEIKLAEAYFYGNEAEKSTVFNGKDNTLAMIETYSDGAVAASACNSFYAPGVTADDVNFGQGTWYLPAIGEWIDATGDYCAEFTKPDFTYYGNADVIYRKVSSIDFDENGDGLPPTDEQWEIITEEEYNDLKDVYFMAVLNKNTYEKEIIQMSLTQVNDFVAEHGNVDYNGDDYSYKFLGTVEKTFNWGSESEILADEYFRLEEDKEYTLYATKFVYYGPNSETGNWEEIDEETYMANVNSDPWNYQEGVRYSYRIRDLSKEEYEQLLSEHNGNRWTDENGNDYHIEWEYNNYCYACESGEEILTADQYEQIKDDYYFKGWGFDQGNGHLERLSKQDYEQLFALHDSFGNVYDEDGNLNQAFGCRINAGIVDDSISNTIAATLNTLAEKGVEASSLRSDSWSGYCSSSEFFNSHMYCMCNNDARTDTDSWYTRAFNLIKDKFGDNAIKPIIGDVMYEDLTYGSADDYDSSKVAVGVVVWVSEDGASAKIMSLRDLSYTDGDQYYFNYSRQVLDPDHPYDYDFYMRNFDDSYLTYMKMRNTGIEPILRNDLMSVYAASNPGSMVEVPIEPEPVEPESEVQPQAVAEMQQQFAKVNNEFNAIMADSAYNGIGLLKGQNMTVKLNEKAQDNMVIKGFAAADYTIDTDWQSQADIQATITQIERTMAALQAYAQELSNAEQMMQIRQNFNDAMRDILQVGADNLVLADMNEETANYLAMQTRQQLAINALALAAQSDQSILKLFA